MKKQYGSNRENLGRVLILAAIAFFVCFSGTAKAQSARKDLNLNSSGEKAIELLNTVDSYNSLIRAVKTARPENEPGKEESPEALETKLIDPDGMNGDRFGRSVVISGNTAIVGAQSAPVGGNRTGAAYIYIQSGGTWTLQQRIIANDASHGAGFGSSVAISGDTAVVGAVGAGNFNDGAVYVFIRTGTVWTQQQKLTASDSFTELFLFGWSVAISTDTVVVGAPGADVMQIPGSGRGAAYIYTRSGNVWTQQQKIFASDHAPSRSFGYAVAFSGSTIVVGERPHTPTSIRPGAAYFFILNGTTATQQQEITASDGTNRDGFGYSVAINGDTAIIGALSADDLGSAYVLTRSGTIWSEQQKLIPSDGAVNKGFGSSVSMSGNAAIIGAFADTFARGSAYIFTSTGTTWTQQQKLIPSNRTNYGEFGTSVGISGNTAIIGAPNNTTDPTFQIRPGEAYIFTGLSLGNVSVSGRVTTPDGRGLRNASVRITDQDNVTRTVTTSSFGYYSFDNVAVGQSYTIAISSRLYRFQPRVVQVTGELTNVDFVGLE